MDNEQSYSWLKFGNVKRETESAIVAARGQAVSTNYFKNNILKEQVDSNGRLCKQHEGSINHLTSECLILARNEYLMRHDRIGAHLHYSLCKALVTETTEKWCTHAQASM